jgi:hypothetical protein
MAVQLRDSAGNVIPDVPITVQWRGGRQNGYRNTVDSVIGNLGAPARTETVVASLGQWRDSVTVVVLDAPYPLALRDGYADSSITAMLRFDRETGLGRDLFVSVFRQESRSHTRARLDSLADSLVARIVGSPAIAGITRVASDRVAWSYHVIQRAVHRQGPGKPFDRGHELLARVFQHAPVASARDLALRTMAYVKDASRGVAFLRDVATGSDGPWPARAVQILVDAADADVRQAESALRSLHRSRGVAEPSAQKLLRDYAAKQGWRGVDW